MGISLVTLCLDEMLSCKILDYIQRHWQGEPVFRYISGTEAEILEHVCVSCAPGDKVVVLAEETLIPDVKDFLETVNSRYNLGENSVFIGALCIGEVCKYGAKLYGSPESILSLAYSLVSLSQSKNGVVSIIYPAGRAARLLRDVDLCDMTESLGRQVTILCTDEYGISQEKYGNFLKLLCNGVLGNVGQLSKYTEDHLGLRVLDAKDCAPEIYELTRSETKDLVNCLTKEIDGVLLAVLGSGATSLNLEIMRRSRIILCIGEKRNIEPVVTRYFGEESVEVLSKVVEITVEEYASIHSLGDWSQLWHRI